jgi:hypothetical protein
MSEDFPIVPSLDPYHARIGYLGVVALLAARTAMHREVLTRSVGGWVLKKIHTEDPEYQELLGRVLESKRPELEKIAAQNAASDKANVLRRVGDSSRWLHLAHFWLYQEKMAGHTGFVNGEKIMRPVSLARWLNVLTRAYDLSEEGFVLQQMLAPMHEEEGLFFNPLDVMARPSLKLLYLRFVLRGEMLFPYLVQELVNRDRDGLPLRTRGPDGLLGVAMAAMMKELGEPQGISDISRFRTVKEFHRSIVEGSASTAENYLRPRMEILLDLGLVGRRSGKLKSSAFPWRVTDVTKRLASEWSALIAPENRIPEYLEDRMFGSMNRVYGDDGRGVVESFEETLYWFAKGCQLAGWDMGFTPARTGALAGCLLAWESGRILEVQPTMDAVYAQAQGPWSKFMKFSGGSTFRTDYRIKLLPGLIGELASKLGINEQEKGG